MIDDLQLDMLVDGELSEEERREVLLRLDSEPDGWRRCALAFLEAQSWREAMRSVSDESAAAAPGSRRLLAHPGKTPLHAAPASLDTPKSRRPTVFMAIGPEGGFASEEVALATSAGWQTVDLGLRILRVETAAVFLVATVLQTPHSG